MATNWTQAQAELATAGIKYTRKDMMVGTVSHADYYAQFVTAEAKLLIRRHIGVQRLAESTDPEYFNDIPLPKWDRLGYMMPERLISLSNMSTQNLETAVPSVSLGDRVCIAKQAARMVLADWNASGRVL
jgi:hypothetical protein